jgi:hypothetical protein
MYGPLLTGLYQLTMLQVYRRFDPDGTPPYAVEVAAALPVLARAVDARTSGKAGSG